MPAHAPRPAKMCSQLGQRAISLFARRLLLHADRVSCTILQSPWLQDVHANSKWDSAYVRMDQRAWSKLMLFTAGSGPNSTTPPCASRICDTSLSQLMHLLP